MNIDVYQTVSLMQESINVDVLSPEELYEKLKDDFALIKTH